MSWGFDSIGDAFGRGVDAFSDAVDSATDQATRAFGRAMEAVEDAGEAISEASFSDIGHTVLDVAGMVPVIGEAADLANAGWYAAEGDYKNAAMSAASAVPFAGNVVAAAKMGNKVVDVATTVAKVADTTTGATKAAGAAGDAAKVADTAGDARKVADDVVVERPSWRTSEKDVGEKLGPDYSDQVSFKGGVEVPYGTKGSTRPDWHKAGESVEVKNYNVETSAGRRSLENNVSKQAKQRADELPEGTVQKLEIDVRGQNVTRTQLDDTISNIVEKSDNIITPDNINILR